MGVAVTLGLFALVLAAIIGRPERAAGGASWAAVIIALVVLLWLRLVAMHQAALPWAPNAGPACGAGTVDR
jgi:hypothetical protein